MPRLNIHATVNGAPEPGLSWLRRLLRWLKKWEKTLFDLLKKLLIGAGGGAALIALFSWVNQAFLHSFFTAEQIVVLIGIVTGGATATVVHKQAIDAVPQAALGIGQPDQGTGKLGPPQPPVVGG